MYREPPIDHTQQVVKVVNDKIRKKWLDSYIADKTQLSFGRKQFEGGNFFSSIKYR